MVMAGVTKPAIRRLARRGGCKRLSDLIYEDMKSGVTRTGLSERQRVCARRRCADARADVLLRARAKYSLACQNDAPGVARAFPFA